MLRDTARAVIARHGGAFPEEVAALLDLPGIGRYTAGALRAFAFGKPAVLVDGNVARVLARVMDFREPVDASAGNRRIWQWAEQLADDARPREYHAAVMELGQTHCRNGMPDCLNCPVARFCRTNEPERLPVKARKVVVTDVAEHALWIRDRNGRLLLHRESGGRRTGLWKLPLRQPAELQGLPVVGTHRYGITRYRVTLRVHDGGVAGPGFRVAAGDAWIDRDEVTAIAMAAPFRKVAERLLEDL
jgi:A/G-specific adenine glycosylase